MSLALGASHSARTSSQAAGPRSPSTATSCGASIVGGGSEKDAGSDCTLSTSVNLPIRPPDWSRSGWATRRSSSGDDDKESIEDLSVEDLAFMSNVLNDALFTDAPPFDDLAGVVIPVGDP